MAIRVHGTTPTPREQVRTSAGLSRVGFTSLGLASMSVRRQKRPSVPRQPHPLPQQHLIFLPIAGGLSPSCPTARMIPPASACGSSHRRDPDRQPQDPPAKPLSPEPRGHPCAAARRSGDHLSCFPLPSHHRANAPRTPLTPHPPFGRQSVAPAKSSPLLGSTEQPKELCSSPGQRAGDVEGSALLGVEGGASPFAQSLSVATSLSCRLFGCAATRAGALLLNKEITHALRRGVCGGSW